MYIPAHNAVDDQQMIDEFVRAHEFATLVTCGTDGVPFATHIPLVLHLSDGGERILHGHVARANPHWKLWQQAHKTNTPTLAIFHGAHSYVSPRWYTQENVPTWNYQVVHAYRVVEIFTIRDALYASTKELTERYEHGTGYSVDGLSERLLEGDLRGIVDLTMRVERFEAKFKISQNRDAESCANVVHHLEASDNEASRAIAEAMKRHNPHTV